VDGTPKLRRPRPRDVGKHPAYAQAYAEVLTESQREALRHAATTYLDECFMALENTPYDQSLIDTPLGAYLPERFAHFYDHGFGRAWTTCVAVVGAKLAQRSWIKLSCVAEELALNAIVLEARAVLGLYGKRDEDAHWDGFYEFAFEDEDWKYLFDDRLDGIEDDPDAIADLMLVNLSFARWFRPFGGSNPRPHPFVLDV
jgi:hypothetical protein